MRVWDADDLEQGQGCFRLARLSLYNCNNITIRGVASLLRNLPCLTKVFYDRLADAIETVAKVDGEYIAGKKVLKIDHLDQFGEFYDFDSHPDVLAILIKVRSDD